MSPWSLELLVVRGRTTGAERRALARDCERVGMVLMIEPRLAMEKSRPDIRVDPAIMKLYCRISAEVGADIVKCIWSESVETMRDIAATCPVPVLMAGGPKKDTVAEAIKMAQQAMEAGCQGLVFGRNVYQSPDPASVLAALREGAGELLEDVALFDVYAGKGIEDGKKSLAFGLRFRAADRTLTADEASAARENAVAMAASRFGAVQR